MTADFAGLFGSEAGDQLVDFCKRHKLPLAWSLGDKKNKENKKTKIQKRNNKQS